MPWPAGMGGSRKGFGGGIARYLDMIEIVDDLRSIYERQLIALTAMKVIYVFCPFGDPVGLQFGLDSSMSSGTWS